MSAIDKAAKMLLREAESMKECHTVGVGGEWYGDSAQAEYDEMIATANAAIAERDELRAEIDRQRRIAAGLRDIIANLRVDFQTAHARMMTSAATEREACAQVCENHPDGLHMLGGAFARCAAAIRARGNA